MYPLITSTDPLPHPTFFVLAMSQLPPSVDLSKIPFSPQPAGQISNFVDPPSLAHVVEVVGGLLIAIETMLLVLRTVVNVRTFSKLRLEDCRFYAIRSDSQPVLTSLRLGGLCSSRHLRVLFSSYAQ